MDKTVKAIFGVFCSLEEKLDALVKALQSANDHSPEVFALQQTVNFSDDIQNTVVLKRNVHRQGFIVSNASSDDIFLSFDQNECSDTFYAIRIPTDGMEYYIPNRNPYTGEVRIFVNDTTGFCTITELSY